MHITKRQELDDSLGLTPTLSGNRLMGGPRLLHNEISVSQQRMGASYSTLRSPPEIATSLRGGVHASAYDSEGVFLPYLGGH